MSRDVVAIWAEATNTDGEPIMGASDLPSGLPWPAQPADLRHFREVTRDRVLVMGRKTFEALPAELKTPRSTFERPLLILTHSVPLPAEPALASYWHAGTFETPIEMVAFARAVYPEKGIAVIGGPAVIEWAEPVIDRVDLTAIWGGPFHGDVPAPGDLFFDSFAQRSHMVFQRSHIRTDDYNKIARTVTTYARVNQEATA